MACGGGDDWRNEKMYWLEEKMGACHLPNSSGSRSKSSSRSAERSQRYGRPASATDEDDRRSTSSQALRKELDEEKRRLELVKGKKAEKSSMKKELERVKAAIAAEEAESEYGVDTVESTKEELQEAKEKLEIIQARKVEIRRLFKMLKDARNVDLCFMVDCTGSMSPYINEVKTRIHEIVRVCTTRFHEMKFRVAFVGYRDHEYGKDRIICLDFSECLNSFRQFLDGVITIYGKDPPEDVFGGLEQVGKMGWKAPTRILFHIGDTPCHGTRFHDLRDNYPGGDPRGLKIEDLLARIKELKIVYWFAELTPHTKKMLREFQKVMGDTIKETELKSPVSLFDVVVDSVSETISEVEEMTIADYCRTVEDDDPSTQIPNRTKKTYDLAKEYPNWNSIQSEETILLKNRLPTSLDQVREPLKISTAKRHLKIASKPFDEGAQRVAYYGLDVTFPEHVRIVFKEFKYLGDHYNTKDKYLKQMEIQSVSAYLAQLFNRIKPIDCANVIFTKIQVVSFNKRRKPFYCTKESMMQGNYVKFNSNCGYVNKDEYTGTLHAFSHWTHHATRGYLMVIDLQGVKVTDDHGDGTKFILTDPSIHCTDLLRFGKTNLGKRGMLRFFETHTCSEVCAALKLPTEHVSKVNPMRNSTSSSTA